LGSSFVIIKVGKCNKKFEEYNVIRRQNSSFGNLENCVRITIGSEKQVIKILDVLNK
jgi:histidinol-phosphate/aromatic aminotransferase/cobyric acid decarboxylase-like protein